MSEWYGMSEGVVNPGASARVARHSPDIRAPSISYFLAASVEAEDGRLSLRAAMDVWLHSRRHPSGHLHLDDLH